MKELEIGFSVQPLGRPECDEATSRKEQAKLTAAQRKRNRIEGKFGQAKNGYGLNRIRARTVRTSEAWIRSVFLVMNLLVLLKIFRWIPVVVFIAFQRLWVAVSKMWLLRLTFSRQPMIGNC